MGISVKRDEILTVQCIRITEELIPPNDEEEAVEEDDPTKDFA